MTCRMKKLTTDPSPWAPAHLDGTDSLTWAEFLEELRQEGVFAYVE